MKKLDPEIGIDELLKTLESLKKENIDAWLEAIKEIESWNIKEVVTEVYETLRPVERVRELYLWISEDKEKVSEIITEVQEEKKGQKGEKLYELELDESKLLQESKQIESDLKALENEFIAVELLKMKLLENPRTT
ncbi:MAG: hypothetical protein JW812_00425 [Alphaproteobacteria bacterium]|nr:hypothetical protein [Alphaproteobacteria bacterium]MBN2780109.1 hypothetical protein [Alphaproteobacteria bacterium]